MKPLAGEQGVTLLDLAMLGALLLTIACHVVAARLAVGWITAALADFVIAVYLVALAINQDWRPLLWRLFLVALVAGFIELFTDFSGERVVHSLVYPTHEPMLWASPVYMPLSWCVVLTQLGYLAWRLRGFVPHIPLWGAVALSGFAGAVVVPFYEEMAYYAGWWRYVPTFGIGHTPFYVMLFEAAVVAILPLLFGRLTLRSLRGVAAIGVVVGLWMPWAALFSWLLIGR